MLSKTCTRILRPYGFEDVHTPLPAQYALNRSIRLGHSHLNHVYRYTQLASDRFNGLFKD